MSSLSLELTTLLLGCISHTTWCSITARIELCSIAHSSSMFHQVRLLKEDQPLLRFLWRDCKRDNPPSVYKWRVLPFSTTCSPCCAIFALQKHVLDHSNPGEDVCETVMQSFYVDNCLWTSATVVEAKVLVDKLQKLLDEGGFELRQWASNQP